VTARIRFVRWLGACLSFGAAAGLPLPGQSQEFPSRNITIVVPFPAGGGTDLFGRLIAQQFAAAFGRNVVIDNRSGAAGNIGAELVARAPADGHTLLYTASTIALNQAVTLKPTFDPQRELAAVSLAVTIPQVLVVHPSLPVKSAKELIALGKSKPGALSFSAGNVGSAGHLAFELLKTHTGLDAVNIAYRGAAPATVALVSGETHFSFLVPPVVQAHIRSGRLRALAVSSRARSSVLAEVPTMIEQGIAGFEALQWHGLFAPKKTPSAALERLNRELVRALASPAVKERALAEGAETVGSTAPVFEAFFKSEVEKWTVVATRSGARQ